MAGTGSPSPIHPSFRDVIENLPAAVYVTDAQGIVVFYNGAVAELTGCEAQLGADRWPAQLTMFLPDGTPLPYASSAMSHALGHQSAAGPVEIVVQRPDLTHTSVLALAAPLRDQSGAFTGTVNLFVDIGNRKEAEAKSQALLSQLIHRERNEIQTIQSLLAGAQREAENAEAKEVLADTARRVGAIAAAQNAMDRAGAVFEAQVLIENLCRHWGQSFGTRLDLQAEASASTLPNRSALPLAIMINELVTISVKHGRGERNRVSVRVAPGSAGGQHVLTVSHDGAAPGQNAPKRRASGLGLVEGLARQLGGELKVSAGQGMQYVVRFGDPAA